MTSTATRRPLSGHEEVMKLFAASASRAHGAAGVPDAVRAANSTCWSRGSPDTSITLWSSGPASADQLAI